jgi:hypothetical protein
MELQDLATSSCFTTFYCFAGAGSAGVGFDDADLACLVLVKVSGRASTSTLDSAPMMICGRVY